MKLYHLFGQSEQEKVLSMYHLRRRQSSSLPFSTELKGCPPEVLWSQGLKQYQWNQEYFQWWWPEIEVKRLHKHWFALNDNTYIIYLKKWHTYESKGSVSYSFMSVDVGKAENDRGREREERENLCLLSFSLSLSLLYSLLSHCTNIVIENR